MSHGTLVASEPLRLADLIAPSEHGITSRVLAKNAGGNVTLFAFDAGEGLSEHTAPFDALVVVLDGSLSLTIGGRPFDAVPGTIVPAGTSSLPARAERGASVCERGTTFVRSFTSH